MKSEFRSLGGRTGRVVLLSALALLGALATPVAADAAPAAGAPGTGPATPLAGSVAPVPTGAVVLGPAAAGPVTVDVVLRPRDPAGLAAFARAVSTPGSPRYHRYLPAGHLATAFGPTAGALAATRDWLASTGLHVGATSPDGLVVPVTGTTAQLGSAFAVPLVRARLTDGRTVRLATRQPSVPSTLVPLLQGVIGLSDQAVARPHLVRGTAARPAPTSPGARAVAPATSAGPQACASATQLAAPTGPRTATDLAGTYGFSSLYAGGRTGAGQTIGLFELEDYTPADISAYQACYGTHVPITDISVDGGAGGAAASGEAALDIEVAAGLAPGASLAVYTGPNDGQSGPLDTYSRMVSDDTASVISTSWGQCEADLGSDMALSLAAQLAEQTVFMEAAAQGQSVLAATGDYGSTDCYATDGSTATAVDDPAAQPYVTGVGGTVLTGIATNHPTEVAWGGVNSSGQAGGGGNSITFAAPSWQQVPAAQSGLTSYSCGSSAPFNQQCREVPDVSASADQARGDIVFVDGTWTVFGGTSMAAPMWAALVAVVDQGCASPAGFLNPTLYATGGAAAFNDVTTGDNYLPNLPVGLTTAFPATVGYDMATGWGSPKAIALLGLLTGAAPGCPAVTGLTPTSGPASGGTTVAVSGSGFGTAPTVTVGGTAATVIARNPNGTSVTVVVPSGAPGPAVVAVTNAASVGGGTSAATAAATFTYLAPKILSVSPARGPTTGGGTVTITGTGFDGVSSVFFGAHAAAFALTPQGTITATVPPGTGGTVDVVVHATAGTSATGAADRYTYVVPGYWMVASDGGIFAFGGAGFAGSAAGQSLTAPVVSLAPTPDDHGYWMATSAGGVLNFGDAGFYGSAGEHPLNRPIVALAPTADGHGYWLVASDGGIFAYGDAGFYGSAGAIVLNEPIVGMAPTADGHGYWLVASDGGIFAYGDAAFHGSTGSLTLNKPIVGMTATPSGGGYWLVASDGGIFAFGSAPFYGSTGSLTLNRPITGMATDLAGTGYWLVASDGGIFAFGSAPFYGSTGSLTLNRPITGMAAT